MTRTCFLFPGSRRTTQLPAADVLCISIVDVVRRPSARGSVSAQVQQWCYQITRATFPTTVVDDLSIVVKSVLSTTIWFCYVTQQCRIAPPYPQHNNEPPNTAHNIILLAQLIFSIHVVYPLGKFNNLLMRFILVNVFLKSLLTNYIFVYLISVNSI